MTGFQPVDISSILICRSTLVQACNGCITNQQNRTTLKPQRVYYRLGIIFLKLNAYTQKLNAYPLMSFLKCLIVLKKYRKIRRNYSELLGVWELEESRRRQLTFFGCDMVGIYYRQLYLPDNRNIKDEFFVLAIASLRIQFEIL